ncbi:coiled-coil domain-containing protein 18-like isoform X3 [Solanum pennellii]|uniref:Coiled-coil domain-containing protein 18-like isoform X3 n=1 Tax=Solanum pennellii TaxID=28526 RepID=A0ABM1GNU2_SOLPN|nr:coiled-coil domain-containing protein 18-like isoform X3 [Solanum pennellii]
MSWLRSAMNKAVEVGNSNLTRTVRNYADSVGHAVAEGAKILQDRIGNRNFKSFKQTVQRLEEASISCKGPERVQLMKRWLAALKAIDNMSEVSVEDKEKNNEQQHPSEEVRKQPLVLYYDSEMGGEPLNFRDVFLYSKALEGMLICMILEAPNEEEISLLLELFELCLTGGKAVHSAIISSIQDLSNAFSNYQDEVLVKREELLQFAESAITGLKSNADLGRIDAEVSTLNKQLDEIKAVKDASGDHETISEETAASIEALKVALAHIRVCSRLEGLLLKKKSLKYGDSPEVHSQKVDKLKLLSESLVRSANKAEKEISDDRIQKEEALKFRVAKTSEVGEIEKELAAEISALEKQRNEIEAQLKQVNISLAAASARLHNAREERDQFYDANDQIVAHLKTREGELSKTIGSCRVEEHVVSSWIKFLEDAWVLQSSYTETKDKEAKVELEKHEDYFVNLVLQLLSDYEKELRPSIDRIRKYVENLKSLGEGSSAKEAGLSSGESKALSPRKSLELEYLDYEAKIITTFSVVDNMMEQFYAQHGKVSRKDDPKIKGLFENIEKLREEFESIERPELEMEIPDAPTQEGDASSHNIPDEHKSDPARKATEAPETGTNEENKPPSTKAENVSNAAPNKVPENVSSPARKTIEAPAAGAKEEKKPAATSAEQMYEAELAKLESESGNINQDFTAEEIGGWEFDELENELNSGTRAIPEKR